MPTLTPTHSLPLCSSPAQGARQMHADAEYLSNVLSALSVQAPPGLGTLLALVTVPAVRSSPHTHSVSSVVTVLLAITGCRSLLA